MAAASALVFTYLARPTHRQRYGIPDPQNETTSDLIEVQILLMHGVTAGTLAASLGLLPQALDAQQASLVVMTFAIVIAGTLWQACRLQDVKRVWIAQALILLLANYFLERCQARGGQAPRQFAADAVGRFITYHWPGNVRELEQAVSGAAAMAEGETIHAADLNLAMPSCRAPAPALIPADLVGLPLQDAKARLVESFERAAILAALEQQQGNVSAAARQLGMHRQSLQQKMNQLTIKR